MKELLPILTAGTGSGLFLYTLMWMVKNIFPNALSKKESWLVFGLCYIPVTFCLIYTTMKSDGGKETPQEQQPKTTKSSKVSTHPSKSLSGELLSFLVSNAYANDNFKRNYPYNASPSCGVTPNTYTIYLTFNSDEPYFVNPGQTSLRVVLLDLNPDVDIANIEINDNGNPINGPKKFLAQLKKNQSTDFSYKDCKFHITYLGYGSFREGLFLLFRTRYFANVKIEKL